MLPAFDEEVTVMPTTYIDPDCDSGLMWTKVSFFPIVTCGEGKGDNRIFSVFPSVSSE
jgi:hypothetical protein